MAPAVPTNTRAGRRGRLVARFQTAEGSPQSSFASGTGAVAFRTEETGIDATLPYEEPGPWMTSLDGEAATSEHRLTDEPADLFVAQATPGALAMLLKSNWGTPVAGVYALASQVESTRWLMLGWYEDTVLAVGHKLVRIQDAWVHRLHLVSEGPRGPLLAVAEYAGSTVLVGSYSGAPSIVPTDDNVFAAQACELRRDPAGANQSIRFSRLAVTLDQGLIGGKSDADWDMMRQRADVAKLGRPSVTLDFRGECNDETWTMLTNARAGTRQTFRFKAVATQPASTLTVDFVGCVSQFRPTGHVGRGFREFDGTLRAGTISGSFVALSLV